MSYIGRTPQIGAYSKLDAITTDGSASYTMQLDSANFVPESVNHLIVSVNGVIQAPTDSFTVSGSTITFASSLSVSDTIDFIMALGNVLDIGTPSDSTVSLSKLTATGTKDSTTFLRGDNTFAVPSGGENTPVFEAYLGSNQTVSSGVHTKISLDNTTINTGNDFDTSTYKFTCSEAGTYFFIGNLRANSSSSYQLATNAPSIYKNGVQIRQSYNHMNSSSAPSNVESKTVHTVVSLSVSDYIEFYGFVGTYAGTPTINATDTYFQGFKLIG